MKDHPGREPLANKAIELDYGKYYCALNESY